MRPPALARRSMERSAAQASATWTLPRERGDRCAQQRIGQTALMIEAHVANRRRPDRGVAGPDHRARPCRNHRALVPQQIFGERPSPCSRCRRTGTWAPSDVVEEGPRRTASGRRSAESAWSRRPRRHVEQNKTDAAVLLGRRVGAAPGRKSSRQLGVARPHLLAVDNQSPPSPRRGSAARRGRSRRWARIALAPA